MHISIAFLLATFAATGRAAPSLAHLDARTMIATPGQHIDTSGWGQENPNVHTTTVKDLLNNSPTSIDGGLGPMIPGSTRNRPGVAVGSDPSGRPDGTIPRVAVGSGASRRPDGTIPGIAVGSGTSRRPDGTIINGPNVPARPIFLPNNVVPTGFSDFGTFYHTFQYSQQSFLNVVSQWQTPGFSINLVRSQFSLWINQMYQTVSLFQGGCGICDYRYAGQFQALATNLLRDIQYALQIIQFQYGSLWRQFTYEFQLLRNIIRVIFGLAASFGINLNSWFNTINLNVGLFQSISIQIPSFISAPPTVLLNLNQRF